MTAKRSLGFATAEALRVEIECDVLVTEGECDSVVTRFLRWCQHEPVFSHRGTGGGSAWGWVGYFDPAHREKIEAWLTEAFAQWERERAAPDAKRLEPPPW